MNRTLAIVYGKDSKSKYLDSVTSTNRAPASSVGDGKTERAWENLECCNQRNSLR